MKVSELKETLTVMEVTSDCYSINNAEYPNEAYTIRWNGVIWEVYYSERGKKRNLQVFKSEHEACLAFIDTIHKI
jgi:hypothetical protein